MIPQSDSLACDMPDMIDQVLERLALTNNGYFGVTVAAEVLSPAQVFVAFPNDPAFLWSTVPGTCDVAIGAAIRCEGEGSDRIRDIIAKTEHAFRGFQGVGIGAASMEPRFYGGLAYAARRRRDSSWSSFPDAEFTLPRLLYRANLNRAAVTLFISREEVVDAGARRHHVEALLRMAKLGPSSRGRSSHEGLKVNQREDSPTRDAWDSHVREACRLFDENRLEKVVLAREIRLICSTEAEPQAILERLLGRAEGSVCFALRRGSSTFLGSTPERLVHRHGSTITTEALAGSAAVGEAEPRQLLSDAKNLLEHSLVVREIVARLERLGADVTVPPTPQLKRFGTLTHLHTFLHARKLASPHVLEIAGHLHPTPAVGGIPLEQALEFIGAHESFDRGRYAGPVGWFDGNGDGELAVALRSGLITGKDIRLYAGAGLVQGSEPEAEWLETDLKFQSFLDALGLKSSMV